MNLEIKKDLASNWFKTLQDVICKDVSKFEKNDTILFGRESAGVPDKVHNLIKDRLQIPMKNDKRSLNIASSVAIILAESFKQINLI